MIYDIAIIIPCYNSGKYLLDAIQSVEAYTGKHSYEIIIVNDGSTDQHTLQLLSSLETKGYNVFHQENKGPAAARNTGVKSCTAEYLLFLDADNKIKPAYIDVGIEHLSADPLAGVVYANAEFFGETSRKGFNVGEFDIHAVISDNYIDMCSVVRKSAWLQVGGLDEERLLIGHEDWEFWISLYKAGWKFLYVKKVLFEYRITAGSLITQNAEKKISKVRYIYKKHFDIVTDVFLDVNKKYIMQQYANKKPLRLFIKLLYQKYFKRA
jgi:glycosyltransferase involved in cell wall biosynthesis